MKTNLIGISGRIGSGKDTVGKMLQWIFTRPDLSFSSFLLLDKEEQERIWQIKKYAYKLKQIVSILTGISVEDLEKQEVRDKALGEEWIIYGYADGFFQSSKGTIMNNVSCSKERYEEELKINWQTAYKHEYTVRNFMQMVGTEAMRNVVHNNIWVNALFADYKIRYIPSGDSVAEKDVSLYPIFPNWIITDVRFPNELQAIKDRNGIVIRMLRNSDVSATHESETALDNYTNWDYIIDNRNMTIKQLISEVKDICLKLNIY